MQLLEQLRSNKTVILAKAGQQNLAFAYTNAFKAA